MSTQECDWIVSAYRKSTDKSLVAEHELTGVSVEQLRNALGRPYEEEDPDLSFVYPIQTQEQASRFERLLGVPIDLEGSKYFLDSFAEEGGVSGGAGAPSPKVRRVVLVFRKEAADDLVFARELSQAPDEQTRASLGKPLEDLGYYTRWFIDSPEAAARLASALHAPLELTAPYDYFLERWDKTRTHPTLLAFSKDPREDPRQTVSSSALRGASKALLRDILGLPEEEPLLGLTPIRIEAQAAALAPLLDAPLDLTTFRYAVDYYHPLPEAPSSP